MKVVIGGSLIGIAAGILAGMVGVGGGIIIVPALVYFFGFDQHTAQGTSLAVLLPPTGFFAVWRYYQAGHIDVKMAALIIAGVLVGGWFGGGWAQQLSGVAVRRVFAIFMVLAGLRMFFQK